MERTGLLNNEQEKFLADAFAFRLNPSNGFYKWLIKKGFRLLVKTIDNIGLDRINIDWKIRLIPIVDSGIRGETEEVRKYVADLLNEKIDFKNLDDYQETKWFNSLTVFVAHTIEYFVIRRSAIS